MDNHTSNSTLYTAISSLDPTARIAALRGVAHSSMAKCIGSIRQDIRERTRTQRDADSNQTDLDQRNKIDEDAREDGEIAVAMGFETRVPALREASQYHAVYSLATCDLQTLITSKWDAPMDVKQMLTFMTDNAQKLDSTIAKALAEAAECDEATIRKMHELQDRQEREQLLAMAPEILLTFYGFGDNGYDDAIENLPIIAQHQLGVKVVEALHKAVDRTLASVMRTKRISELGSIPILKDAAKQMESWVMRFENDNHVEISQALDAGRNLRTLEDVATL